MNRRQRAKQWSTGIRQRVKARKRSRDRHYRTAHRYRVQFYADRVQDRVAVQLSAEVLTHTGDIHVIRRTCSILGGSRGQTAQHLRFQLLKLAQQTLDTFGPIPGTMAAAEAVTL